MRLIDSNLIIYFAKPDFAATALVHDLDLYTHNVSDFAGIEGLRVVDPISQNP